MLGLRVLGLALGLSIAAPAGADSKSKSPPTPVAKKTTPKPKLGPGRGNGERHVARSESKSSKKSDTKKTVAAKASKPNSAVRNKIAGESDKESGDDPELKALHDAESVLFPKPLPGSTPGFSWDVPKPSTTGKAEVVASGLPPAVVSDPGLDDTGEVATDAEWIRSLTLPDLPVRLESRVVRYLKFYRDNSQGRAIARAWAKKSGRYVSSLKGELQKAGLPTDLVWLSLIESGHNPTIVSRAGAAGLWQFMPESGRVYGLSVDRWVDERLDPKRSTEAAVLYLSDLHRRFGTWELAMAAYNMGYGGLSKAIRKFNTNDYWELCRYEAGIPWETTLYVPKIFAIAVVMTNKKAFGLDDVNPDPPESFDAVIASAGTPLEKIAQAAEVPVSAIESLNPQLLLGRIPPRKPGKGPGSYRVRVPKGVASAATDRLAKSDLDVDLEPYVVRTGDSVSTIANSRGSPEGSIKVTNRIRDRESLDPGTVLLVPKRTRARVPEAALDTVVVVSPEGPSSPIAIACFIVYAAGTRWPASRPRLVSHEPSSFRGMPSIPMPAFRPGWCFRSGRSPATICPKSACSENPRRKSWWRALRSSSITSREKTAGNAWWWKRAPGTVSRASAVATA